jgi:hypothetical protein
MRAGAPVIHRSRASSKMFRRRARERFNPARRQRAGQDARRLPSLGQDAQALCEMSAPAGAVTSRREAHAQRPLAEPLPAVSAARGWRISTMSSTPRAPVLPLRYGAWRSLCRMEPPGWGGSVFMQGQGSEGHEPGGASAEAAGAHRRAIEHLERRHGVGQPIVNAITPRARKRSR